MKKATIIVALLFLGIGTIIGISVGVSAEESLIPPWIKNTAGFWANDQISDREFLSAMQFLIREGILVVPAEEETQTISQETKTEQKTTSVFPDPNKDPWEYVERYNNEQAYRDWFHKNFPGKTIYEVVGLPEPKPTEKSFDTSKLRKTNANWVQIEVLPQDDFLELRISLLEGKIPTTRNYVSADGFGKFRMVNSEAETVYSGTVQVKEEDFGWYTRILTGEQGLFAIKKIPYEDIKKSESPNGIVYFKFEGKDVIFDEIDIDIYGLPTFSSEEISALFEKEYEQNSIEVNKKISKEDFEVTIKRIGFFKEKLFEFSDTDEYFRVDMSIKNISNEKEYASLGGLVILDNKNNQYDEEYGGTLDAFREIYPGVTNEGYVLFEKIPEDASSIKIVFELGRDSNYKPYTYEFNIPLVG